MTNRETAKQIVRRLSEAGFAAFWVGGCVRDNLLGRDPGDYDIATSARPEETERLFPKTIPVGKQFGVLLVIEDDHPFQVATFRAEGDYRDGRRPGRVEFAEARADALRRDFTVNGLFYDPIGCRLYDWVGGEADLKAKQIRTIGPPKERFAEDHLRLLRAVRLAAQLDFQIEPGTYLAIQSGAASITRVSAERIRDELIKLLWPPHAARGLEWLRKTGLLERVLPEVMPTIGCEQPPDFHPEGTVYEHTLLVLENLPRNPHPVLPWAALLHDLGKPGTFARNSQTQRIQFHGHEKRSALMAGRLLRRLRFPRKQIEEIVTCVRLHMQFKDALEMRKSTLRQMLLRPTFPIELELHRADCLGSHRQLQIYKFLVKEAEELQRQPQLVPPLITGRELIELGMPSGPEMGLLLAEIREKQLQDELTTPESALGWARQRLKEMKRPSR